MMESSTKFALPANLDEEEGEKKGGYDDEDDEEEKLEAERQKRSGITVSPVLRHVLKAVASTVNVALVPLPSMSASSQRISDPSSATFCFAGAFVKGGSKILVRVDMAKKTLHVYAEDIMIGGSVNDEIAQKLKRKL